MSDSKIIFYSRYLALAIMAAPFWCLYSRKIVTAEAMTAGETAEISLGHLDETSRIF